jgi:hypothetical protein
MEKVGTLGFQDHKRNQYDASKKRAMKTKLGEALTGKSASGQSLPLQSDQPQT